MKRQSISAFFRSIGLAWLFDYTRYQVDRIRKSGINKEFKRQHPGVALPPPYMIYESFQMNYNRYYNSGLEDAQWILDHVSPFVNIQKANMLDWGCGPARIIRHMPAILGNTNEYVGVDYNQKTIVWCKQNIPGITFILNKLNPPLSFDQGKFDLIYGISVLTHLSESSQRAWSAELHRILKPNGVLFVTTLGDAFVDIMTESELLKYNSGSFVDRSQVKEGHRMYAAFHPPAYMIKLFESIGYTILKHESGKRVRADFISQDIWVLRK